MKKIIVLGAGNMGKYIAQNLSKDYQVSLADHNERKLKHIKNDRISVIPADLSQNLVIEKLVKDFDFVVSALPERFGYEALKSIIKNRKSAVDISFWEQSKDRLAGLSKIADKNKLTVFVDSGIAPGFSNALVAYFDGKLKKRTKNAQIYVGGIPEVRKRGFFAPWSVAGLIEEYKRSALIVKEGKTLRVQALSTIAEIKFPKIGLLEAAVTDGLRSIAFNLKHVSNMSEFTLRYTGHFELMKMLRELGFFDDKLLIVRQKKVSAYEISEKLLANSGSNQVIRNGLNQLGFNDKKVRYDSHDGEIAPVTVTAEVLAKKWKMKPADRDILVMRIQADDGKTQHTADVFSRHNGKYSAMALTTGGMAALATRVIIEGKFKHHGVFPLENVIKKERDLINYFIRGLQKNGVKYSENVTRLAGTV